MGTPVGDSVGSSDGWKVGPRVGSNDGAGDGCSVGNGDGFRVFASITTAPMSLESVGVTTLGPTLLATAD